MDCPSKETLARMPLAEGVLWLLRTIADEKQLHSLWDRFRGRCYEKLISFPLLVKLIADALLQYKGSGRRSFEKSKEAEELEASLQAAYKKLGCLPLALSQALLTECTATLRTLFPSGTRRKLPKSLRTFQPVVLDGKAIKRVVKRLLPLRGIPGGLLGGRALVALEWSTGLATAMKMHEDGDANDVRFVAELVPVVRAQLSGPLLWVADCAFCDLEQPARFSEQQGDHFLVRFHPKVKFHPDPQTRQQQSTTEDGLAYVEEWGWLGNPRDKRRRYVRRIRLSCPGKEVILVTGLLDAERYPAEDLMWLYRERWGIEQMFQKVTEVFGLQGLIGGTPKACLFQFAFCLLLYNVIQVVRGYVAEGQGCEPETISTEKLFDDVERQLISWNVMIDPPATLAHFARLPRLSVLQNRLRRLLGSAWSATWNKSPKQKRSAKTVKKRSRNHNSVYRILQAHTRRKPKRGAKV